MKRERKLRLAWKQGCVGVLLALVALTVAGTTVMFYQGKRTPQGQPVYVALGSSFAAGAGLGALQTGSPLACARSANGYPSKLARLLQIEMVDMTCGGAVSDHLLDGGQFFQDAQIRVIDPRTQLVTITVGGNDVGYIGDMSMLAARNSDSLFGLGVRWFWSGPKSAGQRDFAGLEQKLLALVGEIRRRAPGARVVMATYPAILPPDGNCARLSLEPDQVATMRAVGDRLAESTRAAAARTGSLLVDMNALGRAHDACSVDPWISGWTNGESAPFHPTLAGATATAQAIARAIKASPD
jgi:lysophospholipase L1-like esterase